MKTVAKNMINLSEKKPLVLVAALISCLSPVHADDNSRRSQLKALAASEFNGSSNHCETFAKVAEAAASSAPSTGAWLEDMRLVIIGSDWERKERGEFWSGIKTGDSGFKAALKDGSSQVEHAMAAIYLGKGLPTPLTSIGGTLKELKDAFQRGESVSTADVTLWSIGEDIGARVYDGNLKQIGTPIRNTMCE